MKQEFRVTIDASGTQPAEQFLNTLKKMADKAEHEHGIAVAVERIETTNADEPTFKTGGEYGRNDRPAE